MQVFIFLFVLGGAGDSRSGEKHKPEAVEKSSFSPSTARQRIQPVRVVLSIDT